MLTTFIESVKLLYVKENNAAYSSLAAQLKSFIPGIILVNPHLYGLGALVCSGQNWKQ